MTFSKNSCFGNFYQILAISHEKNLATLVLVTVSSPNLNQVSVLEVTVSTTYITD